MRCPVCGFNKPVSNWIVLRDEPQKNTVAPRISYYRVPNSGQYDVLYACPQCGVVKIRKVGDR